MNEVLIMALANRVRAGEMTMGQVPVVFRQAVESLLTE